MHIFLLLFVPFFLVEEEASARCVPLNSSVVLFDEYDASTCPAQVEEAVKLGNKNLNLLFTAHFRLGTDKKVAGYCLRSEGTTCTPMTEENLTRLRGLWKACLQAVAKNDLNLSVYIQIDEGTAGNTWRNNLRFDPLEKHDGYSYDDILARPIAELVAETMKKETPIEFSLQGEMGATTGFFPASYVELRKLTKQRLAGFKSLTVGVNYNYAAVLGLGTKKTEIDIPEVQKMLNAMDFVGISTYHEVMVPTESDDFRFSYDQAKEELKSLGLRIPAGKRTRISEIGIGGGNFTDDGKSPAPTIEILAAALWSGLRGPYDVTIDPFQKPEMRDFRRNYYKQLLKYLAEPPPEFNLRSAYLWSSDSWDVQGLYPSTRGWQDDTVIDAIRAHNASCSR